MGKWIISGGAVIPAPGVRLLPDDLEAMLLAVSPERRAEFLERWGWLGSAVVTVRGADGRYRARTQIFNTITTAGKNLIRSALSSNTTDALIRYLALGSNNTAPAIGNTALGAEQYRKAVTAFNPSGLTDGATVTRVLVPAPDATAFTTEELGWFASPSATASSGTGILVARVLYHRAKSASESLQIDRTDQF